MRLANPVLRYKELLIKSKILKETDLCIIDPSSNDLSVENSVILLQQGTIKWDLNLKDRIKFAITPNCHLHKQLKDLDITTYLLEFPLEEKFFKTTNWNERISGIYYHGRILPGKVSIGEVETITGYGINITMRGPVCKEYWTNADIESKEVENFKIRLETLVKENKVVLLDSSNDLDLLRTDLNNYKFYFTLSTGESFNVALQEAIACGTIPLVRSNMAYWWADLLYLNLKSAEDLIFLYQKYSLKDNDTYSSLIAEEIKLRCSSASILEKFYLQQTK